MRVLLFGRYADLAGWREREFSPPVASVAQLIETLAAESPALASELAAPWTLVARNQRQVRADAPLGPDDEVAFMPPMSGG